VSYPVASHFPVAPENYQGDNPPAGRRRWSQLPIDYGVFLLAVAFFVVFAAIFVSDGDQSEWMVCYVRAAERMVEREPIHRIEPVAYAYPPAMAMLALPLAVLPRDGPLYAWYVVNIVAAVSAFGCAWRLMGGPSLVRMSLGWSVVFWLGVVLSLRFFVAPLENQQTDMVIAALVFGGCLWLWRSRDVPAAVCLGAAAAMKCTPLLFAPYLAWRGKWKTAGVLIAVAVALNVLPDVVFPQSSGGSYLADWSNSFLGEVGRSAPGVWFSDILLNQSLAGLFNRFAQFGLPISTEALDGRWTATSTGGAGGLRLVVYGTALFLLAATWSCFGRAGRRMPSLTGPVGRPLPLDATLLSVEAAAVVCLMLLLSPMSSKAHYVVMLLPALLVARSVVQRPTMGMCLILAGLLLTGPLTAKGLIGKQAGDLALAYGVPTWFVLLSLLAMWRMHGMLRPARGQLVEYCERGQAADKEFPHHAIVKNIDRRDPFAGRCDDRFTAGAVSKILPPGRQTAGHGDVPAPGAQQQGVGKDGQAVDQ